MSWACNQVLIGALVCNRSSQSSITPTAWFCCCWWSQKSSPLPTCSLPHHRPWSMNIILHKCVHLNGLSLRMNFNVYKETASRMSSSAAVLYAHALLLGEKMSFAALRWSSPPTSQTIGAMHLVVDFKGDPHHVAFRFLWDTAKPPTQWSLTTRVFFFSVVALDETTVVCGLWPTVDIKLST